jgi:hypothetical protein
MIEEPYQNTSERKSGLDYWFHIDGSVLKSKLALENQETSSINEQRVELTAAFLDGKDHVIHKTTRAGFTTSFVKAASRSDKRVLLIAPTRKIISDTMGKTADIVRIYGNAKCIYNQEAISKEPLLAELPLSIPEKCEGCKHAEDCPILDIERDPDAQMISLTYAKFEAIMCSDSKRATALREIIGGIDVVMCDEAHHLVANDVPKISMKFNTEDLARKLHSFPLLCITCNLWERFKNSITYIADDLMLQVEDYFDTWLIRELDIQDRILPENIPKFWGELRKLAKQHKKLGVSREEVLALRDITTILSSDKARLSYIREDEVGSLYICAKIGRLNGAIHDYLKSYAKGASAIFVSGTMFEPFPDFFQTIVGRENLMKCYGITSEQDIFPDLMHTNTKMTVYADTFRLSGTTPQKMTKIPDIVARIEEISEAEGHAPIHLFSPNIKFHERLKKELKGYPNIFSDYYRSDNTMGVKGEMRIAIAVGQAEVPKNAYDCLANSYDESQTIRVGSVDAATWQAWSRVKDPDGETPSKVYCIGVKSDEIARILTWGLGRKVKKFNKSQFVVECDLELPKPSVKKPYKKQVHKEQRKSDPYIRKIWDVDQDLTGLPESLEVYELENLIPENSKSTLILPIRDYGENGDWDSKVRCFGALLSEIRSYADLRITADTLDRFYRSNKEKHAQQQTSPDWKGRIGYRPHNTNDWEELVMEMLFGEVTPATYGVGEDGLTVQCAFDVDNHKGDNPARPRLVAIIEHIKKLGIELVVVASGSPDSYHVYIPIVQAPINIVHDFIKTVLNEIQQEYKDLEIKKDTEAFPKQKTKHKALGNALKLPGAVNRKTGIRSELLDPDTLEPVESIVITKVVELREPEMEVEKVGARQYLSTFLPPATRKSYPKVYSGISGMRPCILAALDMQLDGSEGHAMRIAIVGEALAAGKTRDEIVAMFEPQWDFVRSTTSQHVDYIISKEYKPWKCETIRDRCSKLVNCDNCPLNRNRISKVECAAAI